jgi:hypothetical protein
MALKEGGFDGKASESKRFLLPILSSSSSNPLCEQPSEGRRLKDEVYTLMLKVVKHSNFPTFCKINSHKSLCRERKQSQISKY